MNVALVYDRVNKWGGAERVLLALHELWPAAPLFTAVYDSDKAPWAKVFDVRTSFLQHIPFAKSHHEFLPIVTPMAFEAKRFDGYDVVLSITSAEAKNIITKPETLHICYCLTPTRYLWSGYETYTKRPGLGILDGLARVILQKNIGTLRRWDAIAAERPDYYIAISNHVADRIKKYYDRSAEAIIYPPVDIKKFQIGRQKDYFLAVSRLVGYKRIDVLIEAFNKLGWPLIIIGDGSERSALQNRAKENITFITRHLTDAKLAAYYGDCRAFVFAADEDFGIVAAEAQACGKPVIAYKNSGIAEIIIDRQTGLLFDKQSKEAVVSTLRAFAKITFEPEKCRNNALRFRKDRFKEEMKETVNMLYNDYQRYNFYKNL